MNMLIENTRSQSEADNLRSKAKHALRLAEEIADQFSTKALKTLAAKLLHQAESLEHGARTVLSAQQQQQGQSTKEDQSSAAACSLARARQLP
jgi:hypothetical protein